jgi:hypothetical protein
MISVHDLHRVPPETVGAWARHIAEHLRDGDRVEVEASSGSDPRSAVALSILMSSRAYAVLDRNDVPVCLYGVSPHPLPGVGVVWLLGTDGLYDEALPIARVSKAHVAELQQQYPLLWNYVDERNTLSIRWLRWMGFKAHGVKQTASGHPFRIFARTAHV